VRLEGLRGAAEEAREEPGSAEEALQDAVDVARGAQVRQAWRRHFFLPRLAPSCLARAPALL